MDESFPEKPFWPGSHADGGTGNRVKTASAMMLACLTAMVGGLATMPAVAAPEKAKATQSVLAMGCYARSYPPQHLRQAPAQTVERITLRIGPDWYGTNGITFGMDARLKGKPQAWRAGGTCRAQGVGSPDIPASIWQCQPDTDGAPVIILKASGKNLVLENPRHLQLFDDRTGPDLNTHKIGGAAERQFVLMPVDAKLCGARK